MSVKNTDKEGSVAITVRRNGVGQ